LVREASLRELLTNSIVILHPEEPGAGGASKVEGGWRS
jgi:hypothetical protein